MNEQHIEEMLSAYRRGSAVGRSFSSGNYKATVDRGKIVVASVVTQQCVPVNINSAGIDEPVRLKIEHLPMQDFNLSMCDGRRRVCFGEAIAECSALVLRHWQDGDRFKPFGMHGRSRLVSDLFTDLKISDADKRRAWLLEADGEIIWVLGYRSGDLYRLKSGDEGVYFLSME